MTRQIATLVIAFWLLGSGAALAETSVVGFELVSSSRVSRTEFDYVYRLRVTNSVPALSAVTARITSMTSGAVVKKAEVAVGNLGVNVTQTTVDTFTIRQDRALPLTASALAVAFIPGPGAVAQQLLQPSTGGLIQITDPASPLRGTVVDVPPDALPNGPESITIGYANTLPGALPDGMLTAGVVPVSKSFSFERSGTGEFKAPITITIPYSVATLGEDLPTVVTWNVGAGRYDAVEVLDVNQAAGTVTFRTIHFSDYLAIGQTGLVAKLIGNQPFDPTVDSVDTGFRPDVDGFETRNFTTITGPGEKGVCYGLLAFAEWFFKSRPNGPSSRLYRYYGVEADPTAAHIPQENALARELIDFTFFDTDRANRLMNRPVNELSTVTSLINALRTGPQIVTVAKRLPLSSPPRIDADVTPHVLLVYRYDAGLGEFAVYDPNHPHPMPQPQPLKLTANGLLAKWTSDEGETYDLFFHNPSQSMVHEASMAGAFALHRRDGGSSLGQFNTISVLDPVLSPSTYPNGGGQVEVDLTNGIGELHLKWDSGYVTNPPAGYPAVLHYYQNGQAGKLDIFEGMPVTVPIDNFDGNHEFVAFVSLDDVPVSNVDPRQDDIAHGYDGFIRLTLVAKKPPPSNATNMIVPVRTDARVVASFQCTRDLKDCPPLLTGSTQSFSSNAQSGSLMATIGGAAAMINYSIQIQNSHLESSIVLDVSADIGGLGPAIGPITPSAIGPVRYYPFTESTASLVSEFQFNVPEMPPGLPFAAYPRLRTESTSTIQESNYNLGPGFSTNEGTQSQGKCQPLGQFGPIFDTPGTIHTLPSNGSSSELMGPGTRILRIAPLAQLLLHSGFSTTAASVPAPRFGICTFTARTVITISALNRDWSPTP
jgi:hypothetical protein